MKKLTPQEFLFYSGIGLITSGCFLKAFEIGKGDWLITPGILFSFLAIMGS